VAKFKNKLEYWTAYNRLERAREHKANILQDARAFVSYYERMQDNLELANPIDMFNSLDPNLISQPIAKGVLLGLKALQQRGLHTARQQLRAGMVVVDKIVAAG
jgi:hypothetical protein